MEFEFILEDHPHLVSLEKHCYTWSFSWSHRLSCTVSHFSQLRHWARIPRSDQGARISSTKRPNLPPPDRVRHKNIVMLADYENSYPHPPQWRVLRWTNNEPIATDSQTGSSQINVLQGRLRQIHQIKRFHGKVTRCLKIVTSIYHESTFREFRP